MGCLGGSAVKHLPLAQGVILGSVIESHITLVVGSLLLPLPVSLPLSLCLSGINKSFKKKINLRFILNSSTGLHIQLVTKFC